MEQFTVTGMSCAACQARVEKAVSGLPGVTSCSVSLLTNSMRVEGDIDEAAVVKAVENAGYGATLKDKSPEKNGHRSKLKAAEEELRDRSTPLLIKRLVASLIMLAVLMYFSMGVHMFGWPVPAFIDGNHLAMGMVQMIISAMIMVINQKFFISGFKGLIHLAPNMDTLVAIGASASYIYSVAALFAMSDALVNKGMDVAAVYMNEFYFESAAMILTLVTVGKTLESYSKGRTTDALKSLMRLAPDTATVLKDNVEVTVPIDEVAVDDIFVVRPGESIPVDGVVVEGFSAVNEAALTGESMPVDKAPGEKVSCATINLSGFLKCRALRVGEDTSLSKIIAMVSDAATGKAPVAKLADRISAVFVPVVLVLGIVVTIVWILLGQPFGYALSRGISVLVVSCPCALGLATPVAIMVGNGVGARNGILFKHAAALQETGKSKIVALDKTGTVTSGNMEVTGIWAEDEARLLQMAVILEERSEHPIAKAICEYGKKMGSHVVTDLKALSLTGFRALPGNGLFGIYDGHKLVGGSLEYIGSILDVNEKIRAIAEREASSGRTPVLFAYDDELLGVIAIADTIKPDSAGAVRELVQMGIRVVMLTGDNERTALAIGREAGVDEVIAGVMPEDKERIVRELCTKGKTLMVGDGINDSPALTRADIGMAIGAGTDVAIDAADVVLMKSGLAGVPAAIRLSKYTYRNIKENLFWALFYNVLLIPLACGVYAHWGLTMNPMWGAAAMSCSSVLVVLNALRLNLVRLDDKEADKDSIKVSETEIIKERIRVSPDERGDMVVLDKDREGEGCKMEKTVRIEGMMCEHCEARVKKTLESLDNVLGARVSHKDGTAVIEVDGNISEDVVRKAVEDQDYRFISMS
ncbi:MAG: heavy metal translocating P-type ATPase [Lachnospiraceae bacterium]|nr:heavy metal translocating P-type ATPase [Lachnospiraceae bacterium]